MTAAIVIDMNPGASQTGLRELAREIRALQPDIEVRLQSDIDREAAARAPGRPGLENRAVPGGDVLSLVLPAAAGVLTTRLMDLTVDWMRRRPTRRRHRTVEIYGPDGQLLRRLEVKDEGKDRV